MESPELVTKMLENCGLGIKCPGIFRNIPLGDDFTCLKFLFEEILSVFCYFGILQEYILKNPGSSC